MKRIILIILILNTITLFGCKPASNLETDESGRISEENNYNDLLEDEHQFDDMNHGKGDFSILYNASSICIKDWDNIIDLYNIFGEPLFENIVILDSSADTYAGSYVKNIEYDGIKFKLFSPKNNGKEFWIMEIEIDKNGFRTSRDIEVGDTVENLKEVYPEIDILPDGRTDTNNCAYVIEDIEYSNYLQFEVRDGVISHIKIYHLLP